MKLERFAEAKQDCDLALALEPENKKAFYRRALANKGLKVTQPNVWVMFCSGNLKLPKP